MHPPISADRKELLLHTHVFVGVIGKPSTQDKQWVLLVTHVAHGELQAVHPAVERKKPSVQVHPPALNGNPSMQDVQPVEGSQTAHRAGQAKHVVPDK